MTHKKRRIIENQVEFFNENATKRKPELTAPIFLDYVNAEQKNGFAWLCDRKRILDYGCGTGTSIDAFFKENPCGKNLFVGVDIADVAVQRVKKKYPNFFFYTIKGNKIPQLPDGSMDGACLLHVLHHSREHEKIFREIYSKLEPGGKFYLADLSSNNQIVKLFRNLFVFLPRFVKHRFSDDLVLDGNIPDKYKVDPEEVVKGLKAVGFSIQEVGYGHLWFFLLAYLDRFVMLSRLTIFRVFYSALWAFEARLLKYRIFQKKAEVFYIKCIK